MVSNTITVREKQLPMHLRAGEKMDRFHMKMVNIFQMAADIDKNRV